MADLLRQRPFVGVPTWDSGPRGPLNLTWFAAVPMEAGPVGEAVRLLGGADVSVAGLAWLERQAKVAEDLVAAGQAADRHRN